MFSRQREMEEEFKRQIVQSQIEIQEQTRKNIAAELHDNIGQIMSLTSVTLGAVNLNDPVKSEQRISAAQDLIKRSIQDLRQLSKLLQGQHLLQEGLEESIKQEINWIERHCNFGISYVSSMEGNLVTNSEKDLILFRLFQEAINNVIKHSQTDAIHVRLAYEEDILSLAISDTGIGFDVKEIMKKEKGLGLHNMQLRTKLLGGNVSIRSEVSKGTCVTFSIPYP